MRTISWMCMGLSVLLFIPGCRQQQFQTPPGNKVYWNFENEQVGTIPSGWLAAQSDGRYPSAKWEVLRDSWGKAMALTRSVNSGTTCNLLLATLTSSANLKLSAKIRVLSGTESQSAGIIWRALNQDNYYLASWDPLEGTLRLSIVELGKLTLMRSVYVKADSANWHTLQVENFRDNIWVSMDGNLLIERQDEAILYPGMIGLWTQADACAMFDDIQLDKFQ